MQNIYSPDRFYLTFPHDGSGHFDKILNIKKILDIYAFIQMYDFPSFIG